jgi:hypothetical protein
MMCFQVKCRVAAALRRRTRRRRRRRRKEQDTDQFDNLDTLASLRLRTSDSLSRGVGVSISGFHSQHQQ